MATAILNRRVIIGWRHDAINAMLDICSESMDEVHPEAEKVGPAARHARRWANATEKCRFYKFVNPESYKSSKLRKHEKIVADYALYSQMYRARFPESKPLSFFSFRTKQCDGALVVTQFRQDPERCLMLTYRAPDAIRIAKDPRYHVPGDEVFMKPNYIKSEKV